MRAEELVAWYRQHNRAPMRLSRGQSEASASAERALEHKLCRVLDNIHSAARMGQSSPSLEYVRNEAPQLLKPTGMAEKAECYVALWQQRGGLPTTQPMGRSDEEGSKAYNFLRERRRELPGGDPQVHAILSAAFPNWAITRRRKKFAGTGESFRGLNVCSHTYHYGFHVLTFNPLGAYLSCDVHDYVGSNHAVTQVLTITMEGTFFERISKFVCFKYRSRR